MSKRYGTAEDRFWAQVDRTGECWLWTSQRSADGYGRFRLANNRDVPRHRVSAHRFAYEATHGPVAHELVVRHRCDNPPCCNPAHLVAGTQAENIADRDRAGRQAFGERNGSRARPECLKRGEGSSAAKLTEAQVREIRSRYIPGRLGYRRLAREYGVSMATVHEIVARKIWRHIE